MGVAGRRAGSAITDSLEVVETLLGVIRQDVLSRKGFNQPANIDGNVVHHPVDPCPGRRIGIIGDQRKLRVPVGGWFQRKGGDRSWPSQVCFFGIHSPSANALLVSSNAMDYSLFWLQVLQHRHNLTLHPAEVLPRDKASRTVSKQAITSSSSTCGKRS